MQRFRVALILLAFIALSAPSTTLAKAYPIGLSLFDPVQIPHRSNSITGARFTVLYGRHHNLHGADVGGLVLPISINHLSGEMRGAQFGLANWVDGDMYGAQLGTVNRAGGNATGFQGGLVNISGEANRFLAQWGFVNLSHGSHHGFQVGFINHSAHITGAQVGILNHARRLDGLQVGLLNIRQQPRMNMPDASPTVFPIVTWSF
jgi:hypothetical protein